LVVTVALVLGIGPVMRSLFGATPSAQVVTPAETAMPGTVMPAVSGSLAISSTSTPGLCPLQQTTDDATIRAIIAAEADAVNNKDIQIVSEIFADGALIRDMSAQAPQTWIDPKARYRDYLFGHPDIRNAVHFDIMPALESTSNEAWYKSGGKGEYLSNGAWIPYTTEFPNAPPYGSEHWVLKKGSDGCWRIVQFDFNASSTEFP
jgi:hypothetical protein